MKIVWADGDTIHRAYLSTPVTITTREWGGGTRPYKTQDMGYIQQHRTDPHKWLAQVYGSINPDCHGASFDNIDEAKAYVEQQALVGITLNKLTR